MICVCKDIEAALNDTAAAPATTTSAAVYVVIIAVALAVIYASYYVSVTLNVDVVS